MAFNFATVCMKDDPTTTPEDVVNLKMHMDKQRLILHEGMQISRFTVFSDYEKQDFADAMGVWSDDQLANESPAKFLEIKPLPEGVHPSFAIREVFKNTLFGEKDKTMFCHPRCVPLELTHSIIFSTLPDKGNPNHSTYEIGEEDRKSIIDNDWATLNLQVDWTKTEPTMFLPYFFQFNYGEHEVLTDKMFDDEVISKYDTFMHFIEGEYDEFVLPMMPATVGKYFTNNKDANDKLNEAYEVIRESVEANWRGTGGEPESKYLEWEHDWRGLSKQTSMMYFDQTNGKPIEDYWARMRLI